MTSPVPLVSLRRVLRSDLVRHSVLIFASTMFVNILNYLFHFAVSRLLGVEGYGEVASLIAVLMITSVPAAVIQTLVVKYVAEFRVLDDFAKLRTLVDRLVLTLAVGAFGVVAAGVLTSRLIAAFLHINELPPILITVLIVGTNLILPGTRAILQGMQEFGAYAISTSVEALFKIVCGIGFAMLGFGVAGAMCGYALGCVVGLIYTLLAIGKFRKSPSAPLFIDHVRLARTTAGIVIATISLTGLGFSDVLLVKHFFSPAEAGLYSAISLSGKVLFFLVGFLPTLVLPKAAAHSARGDSAISVLTQAGFATLTISCIALVGFFVFPKAIINALAGGAFVAAWPYVFSYGFAMACLAITGLIVSYKLAIHRFNFVWPVFLIWAAELSGIVLYHRTMWDVVHILMVGHLIALVATSYRVADSTSLGMMRGAPDAF